MSGAGGTYIEFRSGRRGASAAHVRYLSRESAVRAGLAGTLLLRLPEEVSEAPHYGALRRNLIAYAVLSEERERRDLAARSRRPRTHYKATLSFETTVSRGVQKALVGAWLDSAFPQARAMAFFHEDTRHPHAHVWIDARLPSGRKLNLSAREFRQLDELWNRLYAAALGRDEREHLDKKRQTQDHKRLRRAGRESARPGRVRGRRTRSAFRARELQGAGAYELNEERTRRGERPAANETSRAPGRKRPTSGGGLTPGKRARGPNRLTKALERAVSEALRLYQDAEALAIRDKNLDQERGRDDA